MLDFKKIIKGLTIKNGAATASASTKQLSLTVSDSSTINTTTTIVASQTANRTITLPDADGTLLTSVSLAPDSAVVTDATGALSTTTISTTELQSLNGITGVVETRLDAIETAIPDLANTTLSNLDAPTSINQDLIMATVGSLRNLKSANATSSDSISVTSGESSAGNSGLVTVASGIASAASGNLTLKTADAGTLSGSVLIQSGDSGTLPSGGITLRTGVGSPSRGSVKIDATDLNMSSTKIVELALPTDPTDATSKTYVDSNLGGFELDQSSPTVDDVVTWNGTKYILAPTSGGGGANTALSNLAATSVNTSISPATFGLANLGASNKAWNATYSGTFAAVNGTTTTIVIDGVPSAPYDAGTNTTTISSINNTPIQIGSAATKNLYAVTANSGASNSGDIKIHTGTSSAIRGEIVLDARQINVNGNYIVGVPSPLNTTEAANKVYVDTTLGGFTFDQSGAAVNEVPTWNGTSYILAAPAGTGANTALSNLASTAINADLTFAANPGSNRIITTANTGTPGTGNGIIITTGLQNATTGPITIGTGTPVSGNSGPLTLNTGTGVNNNSGAITITTGNSPVAASGNLTIATGSAVGSNGPSGRILIQTGSPGTSPGEQGPVTITASRVEMPSNAADPTATTYTVVNGSLYYNNTTHKLRLYAAGAWVDLN